MQFDLQDASGTITGIAWDDTFSTFAPVFKVGSTYKFFNVLIRANSRKNNALEIKLFGDTRVETHAALELEARPTPIKDIAEGFVTVRGILYSMCEEKMKVLGEEARRVGVADETGEVQAYLLGEAFQAEATLNSVVEVDGRYVSEQRTSPVLYIHAMRTEVEDKKLEEFWSRELLQPSRKRARVEVVEINKLESVRELSAGVRGEFKGVVRTCGIVPQKLQNGRVKYSLSIVDDSNVAIDVGVFCDADAMKALDIGDVVKMQGTVSSYNTKSITTTAVEKVEDNALKAWWAENSTAQMEELSCDPRSM